MSGLGWLKIAKPYRVFLLEKMLVIKGKCWKKLSAETVHNPGISAVKQGAHIKNLTLLLKTNIHNE